MGNKSLDSLRMHWKNGGKIGCGITAGDAEVASMHCDAHHYLTLKDSYCSDCAEAARQALDQSEASESLPGYMLKEKGERPTGQDGIMGKVIEKVSETLEAQRLRDDGAAGMAAQIEEGIEKRLGELVYTGRFTIPDVVAAIRSLTCSKCRGSGKVLPPPTGKHCQFVAKTGLPPYCETCGVKYCACQLGAEQYQRDLTRTDVIIAPITREWHLFPADQYGTPEFLQLCTDQAKEQRAAGRLAIASALERYVERELMK